MKIKLGPTQLDSKRGIRKHEVKQTRSYINIYKKYRFHSKYIIF